MQDISADASVHPPRPEMTMNLPANLGPTDRALRFAIGYVMLFNFVWFPLTNNPMWLVVAAIGLVPLLTAIKGSCPLYIPIGLNTGAKPAAA